MSKNTYVMVIDFVAVRDSLGNNSKSPILELYRRENYLQSGIHQIVNEIRAQYVPKKGIQMLQSGNC